jgi:hypothetical protein
MSFRTNQRRLRGWVRRNYLLSDSEKSYTLYSKLSIWLYEAYKISLSLRRSAHPSSIEMTFSFG